MCGYHSSASTTCQWTDADCITRMDSNWGASTVDEDQVGEMNETLGQLIRRRRRELNMTQEDLEECSGIGQTTISKLERDGTAYPREPTIMALAECLDVPVITIYQAMMPALGRVLVREGVRVPVVGRVPADSIRFTSMEGNHVREIEVARADLGEGVQAPFALEVSGDCFARVGILSGDVVIVEPANGRQPQHRQIVVVRIGSEVTMKRWVETDGIVELRDGDDTVVHEIDPEQSQDCEVLGLYITYKPLAPR
jgi:SOS-response transcriptional repressor LexA